MARSSSRSARCRPGSTAGSAAWVMPAAMRSYLNLRGYVAKRPVSAGDALARFLAPLRVRGQEIRLETGERAARTARATPRRHPDAAHR
jgi:hypothetical protein